MRLPGPELSLRPNIGPDSAPDLPTNLVDGIVLHVEARDHHRYQWLLLGIIIHLILLRSLARIAAITIITSPDRLHHHVHKLSHSRSRPRLPAPSSCLSWPCGIWKTKIIRKTRTHPMQASLTASSPKARGASGLPPYCLYSCPWWLMEASRADGGRLLRLSHRQIVLPITLSEIPL